MMAWEIIYDPEKDMAIFYCNTTCRTFGRAVYGGRLGDADELLREFVEDIDVDDPRSLFDVEGRLDRWLDSKYEVAE